MTRTHQAGSDVTLAFATPVFSRVMPRHKGVNANLKRLILDREGDGAGVQKSNVGGWHSENNLLKWDAPSVSTVFAWFGGAVKTVNDFLITPEYVSGEMEASAWANVCRRGHYHQPHFHPSSDWSGVYYVSSGNDARSSGAAGCIDLLDPRSGIGLLDTPGRPFTGAMQFAPEPGLLLVFPSWLTHHTHPHQGSGERISIAFNARMLSAGKTKPSIWRRG